MDDFLKDLKGNSDTCYHMDEAWRQYASETRQSQKDRYVIQHLGRTKSSQLHGDRKWTGGCWWLLGGRRGSWCFMGRVSVWKEEVLEMDGGDVCTTT